MAETTQRVLVELGAKTDRLRADLNRGKQELNQFKQSVMSLAATMGVAFGTRELIRFSKELYNLAGEAAGVENAFQRMADTKFLHELREATSGTVSDLELMRKTVEASNFKLSLEALPELFEFARRRAQATGQSVDYLVNSIVMGIGRKSPLILDNLGITAIQLRERLHGVGLESASVGQITEAVSKIAAAEIAKMGDEIFTAKDYSEQLGAAWDNAKVEMGGLITQGNILNNQIKGLTETVTNLSSIFSALKIMMGENEEAAKKLGKAFKVITIVNAPLLAFYNLLVKLGAKRAKVIIDEAEAEEELADQTKDVNEEIAKQVEEIEKVDKVTANWGKTLDEALGKSVKGLWEDMVAGWDELPQLIDHTTESMDNMRLKGEELVSTITEGFAMMYEGMGGGLEEFASNFASTVKRIIAALLGQAVATMIVNGINASKTAGPLALALAPALAAAGAGIAKSLFSSLVPSFANEGQVNKPTLAMVGDYPGAASNPEFMLKKSTLEGLGSNIHITLNSRLKGRDLYQTVQRYERFLNNT